MFRFESLLSYLLALGLGTGNQPESTSGDRGSGMDPDG